MEKQVISTRYGVFMVSFRGGEEFVFNSAPEVLGDLIKKHNRYGIASLKILADGSFVTLPKQRITELFGFDTHSLIELQNCGFIK